MNVEPNSYIIYPILHDLFIVLLLIIKSHIMLNKPNKKPLYCFILLPHIHTK